MTEIVTQKDTQEDSKSPGWTDKSHDIEIVTSPNIKSTLNKIQSNNSSTPNVSGLGSDDRYIDGLYITTKTGLSHLSVSSNITLQLKLVIRPKYILYWLIIRLLKINICNIDNNNYTKIPQVIYM